MTVSSTNTMAAQNRKSIAGFANDRSGNFMMIAALSMLPIVAISGGSLDIINASNAERELQQTLDGAAFAAAHPFGINQEARYQLASNYLDLNLPPAMRSQARNLTVVETETGVTAEASIDVETVFLSSVGIDEVTVNAAATVVRSAPGPLEMSLVIDTTNSMKSISGGWDQAIAHVSETIDIVLDELNPGQNKYVTVIPFTDRVNVGTDRNNWISGSPPPSWNGCVEPREVTIGAFDYALDDSKFSQPKFSVSIPEVTGGLSVRGNGYPHCGPRITGPSNNINELQGALDTLTAQGTGRFDVALAWGWRAISPTWKNSWGINHYPLPYDESRKVVAFLTDGHTNAYFYETLPTQSAASPDNQVTPAAGALIEDLCQRMRDDGVDIFIFYINGAPASRPYFENCAGDPSRFFEIGGTAELKAALEQMLGTGAMRLVK